MDSQQFVDYATGTAFSISLSSAQIRMLYWIKSGDEHVYCHGHAMTTLASLARRGLIFRTNDKPQRPSHGIHYDSNYQLTKPGELILELCDVCGLPTQAERDGWQRSNDFIRNYIATHPYG